MARVEYGSIVVIEYRVRLATGQIVDSSEKSGGPVKFLCGQSDFPRPVEEGLIGLAPGEDKVIAVAPLFGYGYYDPKKVYLVATERIFEEIETGKVIKVPDEFGIRRAALVRSVLQGAVLVDFNHPLAGKTLYFEVKVKDVFYPDPQNNNKGVFANGNGIEEGRD
ncbi:MAG: FKBP-type peptidyl-prolyl cis-trans isomerase [Dissulfurimicrobium sp.]